MCIRDSLHGSGVQEVLHHLIKGSVIDGGGVLASVRGKVGLDLRDTGLAAGDENGDLIGQVLADLLHLRGRIGDGDVHGDVQVLLEVVGHQLEQVRIQSAEDGHVKGEAVGIAGIREHLFSRLRIILIVGVLQLLAPLVDAAVLGDQGPHAGHVQIHVLIAEVLGVDPVS